MGYDERKLSKDHINPGYDSDENGIIDSDKINVDLTGLQEQLLDQAVDIAELNYAQGLNADDREKIFVESFVDTSKIVSSENVTITTGQNGNIKLGVGEVLNSITTDWFNDGGYSRTVSYIQEKITLIEVRNNQLVYERDPTVEILVNGESVYVNQFQLSADGSTSETLDIEASPGDNIEVNYTQEDFTEARLTIEEYGYTLSGTVKSTTVDKDYVPSSLQIDADIETDADTTVELEAFDGNGNSVTWTESELDDKKTVSFSDSSFQIDVRPSTSEASKTPTINDYGIKVNR